jgi:acyl-CoA thioesterase
MSDSTASSSVDELPVSPAQVGQSMYSRDKTAQWLGMTLEEIRAGYARMCMPVRDEMTNGHGICHGGLIFTLADTTFAYACNSHNVVAVAAGCSIEFLKPGQRGDVLVAEAHEVALSGRHGIYDIAVSRRVNAGLELIAVFRGKSAQLKGAVYQQAG